MSQFLILSEGGDGCGLAMRLQDEGHDARIWIRELDGEHRCEGLIQKTDDLSFGDIIIADCTGFGQICDAFRESDRLVFGGSILHDRLESDRKFAKQVMEDADILTPESEYMEGPSAWDDAKEYVASSEAKRLVFKPGGRLSGVIPSYVASDSEDLLQMLEFFRQKVGDVEPEFELQEFIEGVAISTEGWFNGHDFIPPFNHTIERKQLMDSDIGPSGGCTGNLVWLDGDEADPLVVSLTGLTSFLREHSYVGPIDLNAVISEKGIYGLEFTPRFGYDAFPTYLTGFFGGDFGSFVSDIVRGRDAQAQLNDGIKFAAGVRLTIPPWPNEDYLASPGIPVRGWSSADLKMVYPYDICLHGENLVTSGGWGIIGVVNGTGGRIDEAFDKAYRICKKAQIPDKQYRTDLAEVCAKDYRKAGSLLAELV